MRKIRPRRIFSLTFRVAEHIASAKPTYRMKYIVPKAYRVPKAPKNTVQNAKIISSSSQNKPRPLSEGGGEGSQRPSEVFRTQAKSRAKFNKNEKIRPQADFFLGLCNAFGSISLPAAMRIITHE
ncbi:MAG: hypothetical protein IIX44_04365 [Clostridia bacterium]|nr:hypothetical protein [Clostridia bacterium]